MTQNLFTHFAATCSGANSSFLGFPTWYKYLTLNDVNGLCSPTISGINDIWLIAAAVIEIMLRVATIVAIIGVIYGGFNYMTSQGEPDKTTNARMTIINAVGGLVLAIMASVIVGFIAGSVH
jgi:uncharacterized membrane protein